jgi:hypothetical protein
MKRFTAFLIVLTLLIATIPQKSEAVVGMIIKSKTTRTVGGVVTLVSGVMFTLGATTVTTSATYMMVSGALLVLGFAGIPIGLVILDEENADLKFLELSAEKATLLGLNTEEIEIYNSEVEELNLVKSEIEALVNENVSDEEVASMWAEYGKSLSPETLRVASKVIVKAFSN